MSEAIHHVVSEIALEAGELALEGFRRFDLTLKADGTEITTTDAKVEQHIRARVASLFPDDIVLGEETTDADEFSSLTEDTMRRFWVVDPIDGTSSYGRGLPVWGVSIAVIKAGRVVAGCFHNPLTGEVFVTTADGSVLFNGHAASCTDDRVLGRDDQLLVVSRFHELCRCSFPGKVRSLGSTAAHLCYLASGAASAVLVAGVGLWDIAAGFEMARRSGAAFYFLDGEVCTLKDFFSGKPVPTPVVATTPALRNEVLRTLNWLEKY